FPQRTAPTPVYTLPLHDALPIFRRGERVALVLPQRPETAIAYMAIFQMGALALPLSHLFGPEALEYRLDHAQASVAIVEPTTLEIGRAHVWTPVTSLSRMPSSA